MMAPRLNKQEAIKGEWVVIHILCKQFQEKSTPGTLRESSRRLDGKPGEYKNSDEL